MNITNQSSSVRRPKGLSEVVKKNGSNKNKICKMSETKSVTKTKKPRILCVDDDPDITHALESALSSLDIEFVSAFSGQQGIWSSIEDRPDLIITDWLMADGTGEDLVTTIRRNKDLADVPIVVLSCLGGDRMRQRLISMGVDGFVQKPITYAALLAEISRHLNLPRIGTSSK
jgi:PleD family two-component response regulator